MMITILYFMLFITLFLILDYNSYFIINGLVFVAASIVFGFASTLFHIKAVKRTQINDLPDEH